jgi:hypothetical protein
LQNLSTNNFLWSPYLKNTGTGNFHLANSPFEMAKKKSWDLANKKNLGWKMEKKN